MPIDANAEIEVTAFEWVPEFARGLVRDMRPRWACEELGMAYRERLIPVRDKPADFLAQQPWGQVPVLRDGEVTVFESGAILLHLAARGDGLLPSEPQQRADAVSWLFASLNSVEPLLMEYVRVVLFNADEDWARLRRPGLEAAISQRLEPVARHLQDREWLAGPFSVADVAMVTILRILRSGDLATGVPELAAYLERGQARPAFKRALADQLAAFDAHQPVTEGA